MAAPKILNVYPAPNATGIPIKDRIYIEFDQEMDEPSINSGTFLITGPDNDFIFGPDFTTWDKPGIADEQILNSPYFPGFVQGTITFERLNSSGGVVQTKDYTGDGSKYTTRAIFTPSQAFSPGVEYSVLVIGDEAPTDDYDTGVKARTVFDVNSTKLSFSGGYSGSSTETYTMEITSGGQTGSAEYLWYRASDPLNVTAGVTTTGRRELEDGLWVSFDSDSSFTTGETFSVVCKPPVVMVSNYSWSFTTGSGSIKTPPSDSSSSGILDVSEGGLTSTTSSYLSVSSLNPELRQHSVATSLTEIVITFSSIPDASTIIDSNFSVYGEPVNGDESFSHTGELSFSLSQSGNQITLTLDSGQLYENNIIQITVDKNVTDSSGNPLEEDFTSYFTTTYNPLYSGIRRIRLDLGPFISNVPNDTILFAIFEASLFVNAIAFSSTPPSSANSKYYAYSKRQLATCYAEKMILTGMEEFYLGKQMSKTLGDLSISRSGGDIESKLGQLDECIARWSVAVETGGDVSPDTSLRPLNAVKGSQAEDAIGVGREWEPTDSDTHFYNKRPASNKQVRATKRRWVRSYRKRN